MGIITTTALVFATIASPHVQDFPVPPRPLDAMVLPALPEIIERKSAL